MEQIYGLLDPIVSMIGYIGHSIDPIFRFDEHLEDVSEIDKVKWLRRLRAKGITPILVILENVEEGRNVLEVERLWIQFGLQLHWPLTNMSARKLRSNDVDRLAVSVADWLIVKYPEKFDRVITKRKKAIKKVAPIKALDSSPLAIIIDQYKTETGFKRGFMVAAVTALNGGVTPGGTTFQRLKRQVEDYVSK